VALDPKGFILTGTHRKPPVLRSFLNVQSDNDFVLVVAWALAGTKSPLDFGSIRPLAAALQMR
jgi:hypothetical protein